MDVSKSEKLALLDALKYKVEFYRGKFDERENLLSQIQTQITRQKTILK
jgi:hypothetical protein